jgi:anti-anti-sigma regulatory factor
VETQALLIDLREVAFIGASGLNTLITAARDSPRRREPVRLSSTTTMPWSAPPN